MIFFSLFLFFARSVRRYTVVAITETVVGRYGFRLKNVTWGGFFCDFPRRPENERDAIRVYK